MLSKKKATRSPAATPPRAASNGSATFSVIGADVTIQGDIQARADLHVDGNVKGDITCASLVQGEGSRIDGAIIAETARLAGEVHGTIQAGQLVILKNARIEGDVRYEALTIEQGARVTGSFVPGLGDGAEPEDAEHRFSLAG